MLNRFWISNEMVKIYLFILLLKRDIEKYLFPRCGTPGFVAPEIANEKNPNAHYTG